MLVQEGGEMSGDVGSLTEGGGAIQLAKASP
jgi:hypothetical protein